MTAEFPKRYQDMAFRIVDRATASTDEWSDASLQVTDLIGGRTQTRSSKVPVWRKEYLGQNLDQDLVKSKTLPESDIIVLGYLVVPNKDIHDNDNGNWVNVGTFNDNDKKRKMVMNSPKSMRRAQEQKHEPEEEEQKRVQFVPVGFGLLHYFRYDRPRDYDELYLDLIAAEAGTGGFILDRIFQLTFDKNVEFLTLEALPNVINFYRKYGFKNTFAQWIVLNEILQAAQNSVQSTKTKTKPKRTKSSSSKKAASENNSLYDELSGYNFPIFPRGIEELPEVTAAADEVKGRKYSDRYEVWNDPQMRKFIRLLFEYGLYETQVTDEKGKPFKSAAKYVEDGFGFVMTWHNPAYTESS